MVSLQQMAYPQKTATEPTEHPKSGGSQVELPRNELTEKHQHQAAPKRKPKKPKAQGQPWEARLDFLVTENRLPPYLAVVHHKPESWPKGKPHSPWAIQARKEWPRVAETLSVPVGRFVDVTEHGVAHRVGSRYLIFDIHKLWHHLGLYVQKTQPTPELPKPNEEDDMSLAAVRNWIESEPDSEAMAAISPYIRKPWFRFWWQLTAFPRRHFTRLMMALGALLLFVSLLASGTLTPLLDTLVYG